VAYPFQELRAVLGERVSPRSLHLPSSTLLLLLALPLGLLAQEPPRRGPRPSVGGEVGYSRSDLGGPDAERVRSRQGALTGVYVQAPLGGPLSLRTEVLFALKGGRVQATVADGGAVELDIGLAYIEVPLLLRAGVRGGRFRPVVFAGPAPALQIGCDLQIADPSAPVRATCDATALPAFRQFDFGLVAGGGLEVHWPQSALALEARYTTGLRSVLDDVDVRNRSFGIVLSLTF
jgi:Outer membrane protein beta-barrel domain